MVKIDVKIPPVSVRALSVSLGQARIETEQAIFYVRENLTQSPEPGYLSPLEAFLSGLAGCEVIMFQMLAQQLGLSDKAEFGVECRGEFKLSEGLAFLEITYHLKGVPPDEAKALVDLVKTYCPVYSTVRKSGVKIKEELVVS